MKSGILSNELGFLRIAVKQLVIDEKTIIIGRDMENRVVPFAKETGAKWYKAWRFENYDETVALRRNEAWIRRKIQEGYKFVDIGDGKLGSSKYLEMERGIIKDEGASYTRLFE